MRCPGIQVLPPAARDEVAAILGHDGIAAMLRRTLALRRSAVAVDSAAAAADPASDDSDSLMHHDPHVRALAQAADRAAAASGNNAESDAAFETQDAVAALDAQPGLVEVLLDDGRPTVLRRTDGTETPLATYVPSSSVLHALAELAAHDAEAPAGGAAPVPLLRSESSFGSGAYAGGMAAATFHADADTDFERGAAAAAAETRAQFASRARPVVFSSDGRAGISGTLHRIAAMRDVHGSVVGLTLRVGRHKQGAAEPLLDLLTEVVARDKYAQNGRRAGAREPEASFDRYGYSSNEAEDDGANELSPSLLFIGGPGSGKTTMLRDTAQQLSATFGLGRRVVVVDSTNEIGGYGRVRIHLFMKKCRNCFRRCCIPPSCWQT